MKLEDKNKIFFGLIHYILSEQKNVDWILKTSLIDFTGISSILGQKPYKKDSLLNDIIDFITQVKPYHVQFAHYFEHYESATEHINIKKNDWLEPTITNKYDSVKVKPDIRRIVYSFEDDFPVGNEYNQPDIEIFVKSKDAFYVRKFVDVETREVYSFTLDTIPEDAIGEITGVFTPPKEGHWEWQWVPADFIVMDGIYFATKNEEYYVIKDGVVTQDFDKDKFINACEANRLFYLGIHDLDELKKELNANFKGVEINGQYFDIAPFGYELMDYEASNYDSPTVVHNYCVFDYNENFMDFEYLADDFNYSKQPILPGEHVFNVPQIIKGTGYTHTVFYQKANGRKIPFKEYELNLDNELPYLEIYRGLDKDEKIFVCTFDGVQLLQAQIFVGTPFTENDSEVLKRQFIPYTNQEYHLPAPIQNIDSNKVVVQREKLDGNKIYILDYRQENNEIIVDGALQPGEHIILTSFDYKYLYDKIYTWEDKYGRSNNIVNLDGDNFLRAVYEEDRPRELVVSHPITGCLFYQYNPEKGCDVIYTDFKNDIHKNSYDIQNQTQITGLTYDDEYELYISSITVENSSLLSEAPGYILVNSEIIEYNKIDRTTNTISQLKRGMYGTPVYASLDPKYLPHKTTHTVGDIVRPYKEIEWQHSSSSTSYINYSINDKYQKDFVIPFSKSKGQIKVLKMGKINLLEPFDRSKNELLINSCNILNTKLQNKLDHETTTKKYHGDFILRINDDIIPFKTIYKDKYKAHMFHVLDFELPSKYKTFPKDKVIYDTNSFISSSLPVPVTDYTVSPQRTQKKFKVIKTDTGYNIITPNKNIIYTVEEDVVYDENGKKVGYFKDDTLYRTDRTIIGQIVYDDLYTVENMVHLKSFPTIGEGIKIQII